MKFETFFLVYIYAFKSIIFKFNSFFFRPGEIFIIEGGVGQRKFNMGENFENQISHEILK